MVGHSVGFAAPAKKKGAATATKLFLRTDKPKGDAEAYGPADKGKFLGYCVGRLSMPRWMSPQFFAAMKDGTDVERYSDDWVEKIVYVKTSEKPGARAKAAINTLAATVPAFTHAFDLGCGIAAPTTGIQAITVDPSGAIKLAPADKNLYYAAASLFAKDDPEKILEWTIATQANRPKLEASRMHSTLLEGCSPHRRKHPGRGPHLAALRKLPDDFRP